MIPLAQKRVPRRFGGPGASAPEPDDGALADEVLCDFLRILSERFVTSEASFPPGKTPERDSAKMKDDIAHWIGRVWMHTNPIPDASKLAEFNILSLQDEYLDWINRHGSQLFDDGLAIEEMWVSQQLHDQTEYTVVACNRFLDDLTARITNQCILDASTLVWLLAAICVSPQLNLSNGLKVLVAHGQIAHTISLRGLNSVPFDHPRGDVEVPEGWFTFHDPWPARSLLTKPCAEAPITVLENIAIPPYWLISPEDFSKVAVGFLFPTRRFIVIEDMLRALNRRRLDGLVSAESPWFELTNSQDLFPVLRAMGAPLDTLFPSQVGLAQVALLNGDVEDASQLFEEAYRVRPTEGSRALFTKILRRFDHSDLALTWQSRS